MSKTLVIYYSRRGENYVNGRIVNLEKGNTEYVAEYIRQAVGADLFEIKTVKTYSADYTGCTREAKLEQQERARPELQSYLESIEAYDKVVVAGPCWWGTFPCAIFSQLERLDFSGKKVYAVMTHEGSGLGSSLASLKEVCRGAQVQTGLAIHGSDCKQSEAKVRAWALEQLS